jgi:hypothetical protein
MRNLAGVTALGTIAALAVAAKAFDAEEAPAPREQMGDDVPQVIRDDAEFQRLFRESQALKGSRRPKDQTKMRELLNEMRARWGELTGESTDGN